MSDERALVKRANRAGRERPLRTVTPGFWVYSLGGSGSESWARVRAAMRREDGSGGQVIRLDLIDRKGRPVVVEAPAAAPAWCLDAKTAARIGL
ncbi:hypothetical protein GCM10009613_65860 [Pseudonocardia kongjuensis]|uniref:Uncharacterized protein n=1 Tax=Pseudonocardia kongjuensis TaxID=102227 RepID=A0ABN1YCK4_9PSEU